MRLQESSHCDAGGAPQRVAQVVAGPVRGPELGLGVALDDGVDVGGVAGVVDQLEVLGVAGLAGGCQEPGKKSFFFDQ